MTNDKSKGHTPEPWLVEWDREDGRVRIVGQREPLANIIYAYIDEEEADANARRIVACVNSCAGLNPEAYPDVVEALEGLERLMTRDGYEPSHEGGKQLVAARAALKKARGEA